MKFVPLWTAVITPMFEDFSIDYDSFENVLKKQEETGNGILILGSTGEGLNLLDSEKKDIVKFTKSLKLSVPVMAGIGGFHLEAQKEFIRFCDEEKVDALLLVNPIYAKPRKEGQFAWFNALMETTTTPCMVYNVPSRTGVKLHPSVPARLNKKFGHLMGVKEASGSVPDFKAFRDADPNVVMYSGDDSLTRDFVAEGAIGLVSVASNCWPKQTLKYLELCLEGKTDQLYEEWIPCADLLFDAPSPIPVKTLMEHKGWIESNTVRLPLVVEDLSAETEEALLEADKKVSGWYSEFE